MCGVWTVHLLYLVFKEAHRGWFAFHPLHSRRPTGGLKKLSTLDLAGTQVTDAGCATLIAALDDGTLPALWCVHLDGFCASSAAKDAVYEAMRRAGHDSPNVWLSS